MGVDDTKEERALKNRALKTTFGRHMYKSGREVLKEEKNARLSAYHVRMPLCSRQVACESKISVWTSLYPCLDVCPHSQLIRELNDTRLESSFPILESTLCTFTSL